MNQLTHGSLFAGIGGFDLGFERAGIKTVWQVEIDPFCRKVLEKHWPNVQRFDDIIGVGFVELPEVDIITGGFPCQDVSHVGRRIGIDGARSGLWREMRRIICDLRPRFVVVENVTGLLDRGIQRVLGEMAADGFDAEWAVLPACSFGAPHLHWRESEPPSKRVVNGIFAGSHRLRSLGNAVVPQIAEWIGRRLLEQWEARCQTQS